MSEKTKKAIADEGAAPFPDMSLAQKIHRLTTARNVELEAQVFDAIAETLENPSLYAELQERLYDGTMSEVASSKFTKDNLADMSKKHVKTLEGLRAKIEDAKESAGDMEVMEATIAVARFSAKSLSKKEAIKAYQAVLDLPKMSSGKKIDAYMESARIASFYSDTTAADEFIASADKLISGGGDWDRRNRLKVYSALQKLLHRDTEAAASLLLDGIATFNCVEICTYPEFITYAMLTNLLHLPRPTLKKKIIDGPEILSVAKQIPAVLKLVKSFYDCHYADYLRTMLEVEAVLKADRYLAPHASYWMRELHVLAYKQFLDAYQSVRLSAMAEAFQVSQDFIDHHASRMIAADRLSAKIDKFGGVIETNRPDLKNAQYRDMIQKGDLLLNRVQKLARVVDL